MRPNKSYNPSRFYMKPGGLNLRKLKFKIRMLNFKLAKLNFKISKLNFKPRMFYLKPSGFKFKISMLNFKLRHYLCLRPFLQSMYRLNPSSLYLQ